MKLLAVLLLLITGFCHAQDMQEYGDPVIEDNTPIDRPVVDLDESSSDQDSSEVNTYDYDY